MVTANFCTTCGAALGENARFCTNCGQAVAEATRGSEVLGEEPQKTPGEAVVARSQATGAEIVMTNPAVDKRKGSKWTWLGKAALVVVGLGVLLGFGVWLAIAGLALVALTGWNPSHLGELVTKLAAKLKLPGVKATSSGWKAAALLAIGAVAIPGGVGGAGWYVSDWAAKLPVATTLTGDAYVADILTDAKVDIYEMNEKGQAALRLGTTTTDKKGHYQIKVERQPGGSLLVITSGGTYVDEAFLKVTPAGSTDALKTVLLPGATNGLLTPLTTMAAARATTLVANGKATKTAYLVSYSAVAMQYSLESIDSITPIAANDPLQVATSSRVVREEALILSGIDAEAYSLGVSNFTLADALARDLSDGNFDGKEGGVSISMDSAAKAGTQVALPEDAGTAGLQTGLDFFAGSKANSTHLEAPKISLVSPQINLDSLYVTSNALPAFVDGQAASASIRIEGGNAPYVCTLTSGEMPLHFSLQSDCAISYDGTKVLGTSSRRIVGPFGIKVHDSRIGASVRSKEFVLGEIQVVGPPPKIEAVGGKCQAAKTPCTVTAAHASGGSPGYTFSYGILTNSPLGMFISTAGDNAILKGTPATEGSYEFEVCVTDLGGAQACTLAPRVQVVVGPPPSPTAKPSPVPTPVKPSPVIPTPQGPLSAWPTSSMPYGDYDVQFCINAPSLGRNECTDAGVFSKSDAIYIADQTRYNWQMTMRSVNCSYQYTPFDGQRSSFIMRCPGSTSVAWVIKV